VALVRIAEKAHLTVELVVEGAGGHSSMPPRQTAVGILARAVARLEANPMPARLEGPVREMLSHLAPELPVGRRLVLANLWATGPLVRRQLAASPGTDALIRTTTAPTISPARTSPASTASTSGWRWKTSSRACASSPG
jgi:carboxypeptidase PM20D1